MGHTASKDSTCSHAEFAKKYQVGKQISEGRLSKVYEAVNKVTGEKVAVKTVDVKRVVYVEDDQYLKREVSTLAAIDHPHIIRLHDFYKDRHHYHLVVDFCEGGQLYDKIVEKKRYTEKEARDMVRALLDAIAYCHERKIVHRDLKPENLLLTKPDDVSSFKISHFGRAERMLVPDSLMAIRGTPAYTAPEVLKGKMYGEKVDIWSIGVIAFTLLSGYLPFFDDDKNQLFRKIKRGKFEFIPKYWDNVSDDAKDLIKSLLITRPEERPSATTALSHRWFQVASSELSSRDISHTCSELATLKRKLRASVDAVIMINSLTRRVQDQHQENEDSSDYSD